jgi:hypothetical protein
VICRKWKVREIVALPGTYVSSVSFGVSVHLFVDGPSLRQYDLPSDFRIGSPLMAA